jgi:KUP system potassium uptake protein
VAPPALLDNLRHNEVLHETVLVVTAETARVPQVTPAARASVYHHGDGFHEVHLRFGFVEEPDVPAALAGIVEPGFGVDLSEVAYFLGKERVVSTPEGGMARWREQLFSLLQRNRADVAEHFCLPSERVVEIGTTIEV